MAKKYQIALLNVDFDNEYNDAIYFASREEQEAYFNLNTLFLNKPVVNIDIGSLMETTIHVQNNINVDVIDASGYNYMIIKDNNTGAKMPYLFYFVNGIRYTAGKGFFYNVQLDILNTYLIDLEFEPCLIKRAHLNRWREISSENKNLEFDTEPNSQLFAREINMPLSKRILTHQEFTLTPTPVDSGGGGVTPVIRITEPVQKWLDSNLLGWVYVYFNKSILDLEGTNFPAIATKIYREIVFDETFSKPYVVFAFPLLKDGKSINVTYYNNTSVIWSARSFLDGVVKYYSAYILDIQISQTAPFNNFNYFAGFRVVNPNLNDYILNIEQVANISFNGEQGGFFQFGTGQYSSGYCSYIVLQRYLGEKYEDGRLDDDNFNARQVELSYKKLPYNIPKSALIGSNHNIDYNPKLYGEDVLEYRLGQSISEPFVFDPLKMGSNKMLLLSREELKPGATQCYLTLINYDKYYDLNKESIYNYRTYKSMLGVIFNRDMSLPYDVDKLAEYVANNKNFRYLQISGYAENIFNAVGNPAQMTGAVAGTLFNVLNTELTLDNMKNAPTQLKNLEGSPLVTLGVSARTYIEIWEALPAERLMLDAITERTGFTLNQVGNIRDYINIRKYRNFIQADLANISSNRISIPNAVRAEFKRVFSKGIIFWNVSEHMFKYEKENYERWLEDE